MANALISQIVIGSNTYDIKDTEARSDISDLDSRVEALEAYTDYLGVTTTELVDGSTTNPVTINGESVTAVKGNIVNYGSKEFIWNGAATNPAWQEFGDLSALGELAYLDKNDIDLDVDKGTVYSIESVGSLPTFSSTNATVNSIESVGSLPTFSSTNTTVNSIESVGSLPTFSATNTTVNSIESVGSLPSFSYENEVLTFNPGTLPVKGDDTTVVATTTFTQGTLPVKGDDTTVVATTTFTQGTLPVKGDDTTVVATATYTQGTLPTRDSKTVVTDVALEYAE